MLVKSQIGQEILLVNSQVGQEFMLVIFKCIKGCHAGQLTDRTRGPAG